MSMHDDGGEWSALVDLIEDTIQTEGLEPYEVGILKQVVGQGGTSGLSAKQSAIYERLKKDYLSAYCKHCEDLMPTCEVAGSRLNGGLCSWHNKMQSNRDREEARGY